MTIEEILAGESKDVEFKENLPEKSLKYMKSVVAVANGTGGKIICERRGRAGRNTKTQEKTTY